MKTFNNQSKENRENYLNSIHNIASLSALFTSETAAPYLVSRATENIYCKSFKAINLGREDSAIDALIGNTGVGIKTFLHNNGNTLQKVAEFNRDAHKYREASNEDKIKIISRLRNKRLKFASDNYETRKMIYHSITRKVDGTIDFYETDMDYIDIDNIKKIDVRQSSIFFEDGISEYSFNLSKSTLFKRFSFTDDRDLVARLKVNIISDPYGFLDDVMSQLGNKPLVSVVEKQYVILPLYSYNVALGKFIGEKSGLNQWNASGRVRNENEVYIPISSKIHKTFPNFFPPRDVKFNLKLPNQKTLSVKVCQDNSKALMSDPNKALGQWLLRDVLSLDEEVLLTYDMLEEIGIDSVKITKINDLDFEISFLELGSFDKFLLDNNL